mmetsp:Transcript_160442/g.389619  ORF Transcript_160442/g.389619 Transcript_160442/m.389619 type:complete len:402 (-) Transcript_160442:178-1383(-)
MLRTLFILLQVWAVKGQTLRALVEGKGSSEANFAQGNQLPVTPLSQADRAHMEQTKVALLKKLEDPMSGLGLVKQPVSTLNPLRMNQNAWKLPDDTNPFRMHWHEKRQQIIVQGSYPVDGNQVAEVLEYISNVIKQHEDSDVSLDGIHIHINSGSHGDPVGQHAEPGKHETDHLVEPTFLQEDMVTALLKTTAKVTVLNLASHPRRAPKTALLVIDAYCWSGRGVNSASELGDTRLLWNVDLIKFKNKLPHPDSPVWESDVAKKSHLSTASAWTWWNTADKAWILTDVHTGAMSFIGENGFEVKKGPLKGHLQPGDVVYFGDIFSYQWQDTPEGDGCVTIVKEPHWMSGLQLGWDKAVHSMVEMVFGAGAVDKAVAAAVQAENSIEKIQEAVVGTLGSEEL